MGAGGRIGTQYLGKGITCLGAKVGGLGSDLLLIFFRVGSVAVLQTDTCL